MPAKSECSDGWDCSVVARERKGAWTLVGTKIRIHLADDHETNQPSLLAALVIWSFVGTTKKRCGEKKTGAMSTSHLFAAATNRSVEA